MGSLGPNLSLEVSKMHLVATQTSVNLRLYSTIAAPFWWLVVIAIVEVVVVVLDVGGNLLLLKPRALWSDSTLLLALVVAALLQLILLLLGLLLMGRLVADPTNKPIRQLYTELFLRAIFCRCMLILVVLWTHLLAVRRGIELPLELIDALRTAVIFAPVLTNQQVKLAAFLHGHTGCWSGLHLHLRAIEILTSERGCLLLLLLLLLRLHREVADIEALWTLLHDWLKMLLGLTHLG